CRKVRTILWYSYLPVTVGLSELAVVVLPGGRVGDGLHHVPVLGDLAVLHPPQVVVAGRCAAVGALAHRQDVVSLGQHHVGLVVNHLDALLGQGGQGGVQAGYAVGDGGVVLEIGVAVKVIGRLVRVVAL